MSTPGGEPRRGGGFSLGLAAGSALGFVISAVLVGTLGWACPGSVALPHFVWFGGGQQARTLV